MLVKSKNDDSQITQPSDYFFNKTQKYNNDRNMKKQDIILKKKTQLMQTWALLFFNLEHRCIFSYICYQTLKKQIITEDNLSQFHNYFNIISDLKQGFLITQTGEKKKQYKLNMNFFIMLRVLTEKIMISIKTSKQRYLDSSKKKKQCRNCGRLKLISQIQFWQACECGSKDLQDIKHQPGEVEGINKLEEMINLVNKLKSQIDTMEYQYEKKMIQHRKQQQKLSKMKQIDKFMQEVRKVIGYKQQNKIRPTYENIIQAQKLYAPKKHYKQIEELEKIRKRRKGIE